MGKKKQSPTTGWRAESLRGRQSEDNARRVLKEMKEQGILCDFRQTRRGGSEDLSGIDFYFSLMLKKVRVDIPLQVKSSQGGINAHIQNPKYKGAPIYVVNGQSPELRKEILKVVNEYRWKFGEATPPKSMIETEERETMNDLTLATIEPEVELINGQPLTSSKNVAEVFGKEHKHVLEAIKNLDCSEDFRESNFRPSSYRTEQNKEMPMFLMTAKGFSFLAMGFTGAKAAQFKEAYIEAFDEMRERLSNPYATLSKKEALRLALEAEERAELLEAKVTQQTKQLTAAAPKLEIYNQFMAAETATSIGVFAKMINWGPNKLFKALREAKILFKKGLENVPYQEYVDRGYFTVKTVPIKMGERVENKAVTLLNPKGQEWLYRKLVGVQP